MASALHRQPHFFYGICTVAVDGTTKYCNLNIFDQYHSICLKLAYIHYYPRGCHFLGLLHVTSSVTSPRNSWLLPFEQARAQTTSQFRDNATAVMTDKQLNAVAVATRGLDDRKPSAIESSLVGAHHFGKFSRELRNYSHR